MEKCGGAIDCPENAQSVKSHDPSKDFKALWMIQQTFFW